jgi:hypothetical protein
LIISLIEKLTDDKNWILLSHPLPFGSEDTQLGKGYQKTGEALSTIRPPQCACGYYIEQVTSKMVTK